MPFCSWHRRPRDCRQRRLVVVVSLAAYLVSALGISLPASASKASDMPFPCQHHACGCATARQCWEHCCCYTPAQKLAWAHENHVDPPADLVAEVAAQALVHEHDAAGAPCVRRCCAHKDTHSAAEAEDCREHQHGLGDDHQANSPKVTLVIGAQARHCRGLTDLWCVCGAVLTPTVLEWHFEWNVVEWIAVAERPLPAIDQPPPIPPPRV
jgi:hypothetical protein